MTEAQWLAATDPSPMLAFVHDSGRSELSQALAVHGGFVSMCVVRSAGGTGPGDRKRQ